MVFTQHLRDIDIVLYNCSIYAIWTRTCQSSSTSDRSNSVPDAKLKHHLSSSPYTLPRNLSRHIHTATSVRRDESRDTGISGEPASQSLSLLCWIQTQLSKTLRSVSKRVQLSNAHAISVRKMDTRMWMCTFVDYQFFIILPLFLYPCFYMTTMGLDHRQCHCISEAPIGRYCCAG